MRTLPTTQPRCCPLPSGSKIASREFTISPVVRTRYFYCQGLRAQVKSLVWELRFQEPHGQKKIISKSWSRGKIMLEAVCGIIWRHKSSRAKRFLQRIFPASSWEEMRTLRKVGRVFPNSSGSKASAYNAGNPWVQSLVQEDPLKKEMATHSSILAWRIPGTEEPGGIQSMGPQRVRHDWVTNIHKEGLQGWKEDNAGTYCRTGGWRDGTASTCLICSDESWDHWDYDGAWNKIRLWHIK